MDGCFMQCCLLFLPASPQYWERSASVSYTHLDVYKRQALRLGAIETHVADARTCCLNPATSTHRQMNDEQLKDCLLYTSSSVASGDTNVAVIPIFAIVTAMRLKRCV